MLRTAVLALAALALVSCQPVVNDTPTYRTIEWKLDGADHLQYYTDDPANLGYFSWTAFTDTAGATDSSIVVKRVQGSAYDGAGLIFDWQDHSNFYFVEVDSSGYVRVGKNLEGEFTFLEDPNLEYDPDFGSWILSADLNDGGVGVENKIRVHHTGTGFEVYLNGAASPSLTIPDDQFTQGAIGPFSDLANYSDSLPADIRVYELAVTDGSGAATTTLISRSALGSGSLGSSSRAASGSPARF